MKIAVAMSGGIDSTVAAFLLKSQGHDVTGITARFLPHDERYDSIFERSVTDAANAAVNCGIKHIVYDFSAEFEHTVINEFCVEYFSGKTPNPCINCNSNIKFRLLLNAAMENGCRLLATGHYAMIKKSAGRFYISCGMDRDRDQSYFLCMLEQEQLGSVIFPLGELTKKRIREIAFESGITIHDKPDSQEICFIPDNNYVAFLESRPGLSFSMGEILDSKGKILGKHNGIHRYTIGQRRGMGISSPVPLYVTGIDACRNIITAGPREELMMKGLVTSGCHDMKEIISNEIHALVKTRSTQKPAPCTVYRSGNSFIVNFDQPMQGVSPGQFAVFYNEEGDILGCGKIEKGIRLS